MWFEIAILVAMIIASCMMVFIVGVFIACVERGHPNMLYKGLRLVAQLLIFSSAYIIVDSARHVFFSVFGVDNLGSYLSSFALGSAVFVIGFLPRFPKLMEKFIGTDMRLEHNE